MTHALNACKQRLFLSLTFMSVLTIACSENTNMTGMRMGDLADMSAMTATTDALFNADLSSPSPTNHVGFREDTLTYDALGAARTIPLFFWYPSPSNMGASVRYNGFLNTDGAFKDTPLSDVTNMPVLLFSHGKRGMGAASIPFMAEYFARSGWLVVSWEHVGDTTIDGTDANLTYIHRPLDASAVLDYLYGENSDHPFVGRIGEDVVFSGWSRGGYTALASGGAQYDMEHNDASCAEENPTEFCFAYMTHRTQFEQGFLDARIKGLILMAAGDYNRFRSGVGAVSLPTLMWTASDDLNNPNEVDGNPMWASLMGPNKFRFELEGAGHFTFSDLCAVSGPLGVNNGCDDDDFNIESAHTMINEYSMQFVNGLILGDENARTELLNLTNQGIGYENVSFETKVTP